jgi:hypothetical protein
MINFNQVQLSQIVLIKTNFRKTIQIKIIYNIHLIFINPNLYLLRLFKYLKFLISINHLNFFI